MTLIFFFNLYIIIIIIIFFYERIITCLKCAEKECVPSKPAHPNFKAMPGWNDYVREQQAVAREAFWWWKLYNKPRHGEIYLSMKQLELDLNMPFELPSRV